MEVSCMLLGQSSFSVLQNAISNTIMACDVQTSSSLAAMGIVEEVRGIRVEDTPREVTSKTSQKLIQKNIMAIQPTPPKATPPQY